MVKSKMEKIVAAIVGLFLIGVFFSYRLTEVPSGLTVDEVAFGYNATLLAESLHDQNGSLMPIFVHAIDGQQWLQPVTQYFIAGFFKLFGASVFNLRLTSVVITLLSVCLLFFVAYRLQGKVFAFVSAFIFLTTPLIMIQSHMAVDNIMTIPFTILWLTGICLFEKTGKFKYLILAGVSLGIGFYTYKGMRAIVPVWSLLTLAYLGWDLLKKSLALKNLKPILYFLLSLAPFVLIIPYLHLQYPGAVFAGARPTQMPWYEYVYPYLSSFDLTFLFVKGDATPYHSTGRHGMFLLTSLPFFLVGLYHALSRGKYWILVLTAFFVAPILYGTVGSVHRASRLMAIIPLYALIAAFGATWMWEQKKKLVNLKLFVALVILLMAFNYYDFLKYYWFTYPKFTLNVFGDMRNHESYKILAEVSKNRGLTPYIFRDVYKGDGEHAHFYEAIYFKGKVNLWENDQKPTPDKSILLTNREEIVGMDRLDIKMPAYYLHINSK